MKLILKRVVTRLKRTLFPTESDNEYLRWLADGGDEMLRYDYNLNSQSLVLDVGGYKGQWASDIYARYNCRILVFEPLKAFSVKLDKRFKRNPNIEVFNFALGGTCRQETLFLSDDSSSMYTKSGDKDTIQFVEVSEFFSKNNIKNIDLIKINIEGGEYELLAKLIKDDYIKDIKHIQIQFHNISPDSEEKMNGICKDLLKTHKPKYQYKFIWESWDHRDINN